jgi:hypothetical protein
VANLLSHVIVYLLLQPSIHSLNTTSHLKPVYAIGSQLIRDLTG